MTRTDNNGTAGSGCPSPDDLAAHLEGALAPDAAASVEDHLARCPACRDLVADFHVLAAGDAEISLVPDALVARAKSLAEPAVPAPSSTPRPSLAAPAPRPAAGPAWRPWVAVAAAAAILLVAALAVLLASQPAGTGGNGPGPVPEFRSPDRLEVETPAPAGDRSEPPKEETAEPDTQPPSEVEKPERAPEPTMPQPDEEPTPEEVETPETPQPPEPRKPAPSEVEKPEPPAPDKTEPVPQRRRTPLRVLSVRGQARVRNQDRLEALSGQSLLASGSGLVTPSKAKARVVVEKGMELFLNRSTETRVQAYADGMDLEVRNGEVLLESVPAALRLAVPGGWAEPAPGASLLVTPDRGAMRVSVVQGAVRVPSKSGALSLDAGLSVTVDGTSPLEPVRFDANKAVEWTRELRPEVEQVLLYHFESNLMGWKGKGETKNTFRHSRRSLRAIAVRDKDFGLAAYKSNRHLFVVRPGTIVRFACFADRNLTLGMRLWNHTRKQGFSLPLPGPAPNRWAYVQADVNRAASRLPMKVRPRLGDVISAVVVGARTGEKRAVLVMDDFEVLLRKVPGRGHGRTGFRPLPPPPGAPDLDADCRCPNRTRSACCRFARIIRLMRRYQPGAGGGNRRGAGQGQGPEEPAPAAEGDDEDDKPGDDGPQKAGNRPPGGTPPGGPAPGMPGVHPPPPPGPAPVPPPGGPKAGQPEPPGEGKEGDDKEDEGEEPKPEPKNPKAGAKASDAAIHRWLRSQLPRCWPPFTDWKDDCGCGRHCKCRKAIARWLKRNPLPRPIWRRVDRKVLGPFEAWLLGSK